MATPQPPAYYVPGTQPAQENPGGPLGIVGWLTDNMLWVAGLILIILLLYLLIRLLDTRNQSTPLQRDALYHLRQDLLTSSRLTRTRARTIWLTGNHNDPPIRLGRYTGHHRSLDALWLTYRPSVLSKRRLLLVNPCDLATSLDAHEIHLRGQGITTTRDLGYLVPTHHDPDTRRAWAPSLLRHITSPEDLAEQAKTWYTNVIDNHVALRDALNAIEDRAFLRQEVTRSHDERTATEHVTRGDAPEAATEAPA